MPLLAPCMENSAFRRLVTNGKCLLYSLFFGLIFSSLIGFYVGTEVIDKKEIFIPIVLCMMFCVPFLLYVVIADNVAAFLVSRSHSLQRNVIIIFTVMAAVWIGDLVFLLIRYPIMLRLVVEYSILVITAIHSLIIAYIAFRHIRKYKRFVAETQQLNGGLSAADGSALFELILLRKLHTKPIQLPINKFHGEQDDGQLRGLHWDDFYHLQRWIHDLGRGDGAHVATEMEKRMGIFDIPIGGWSVPPPLGIHPIKEQRFNNQARMKLTVLHADDHNQLKQWSEILRSVPQSSLAEKKEDAVQMVTDQMSSRAALYDIAAEERECLLNLAKFGRHLKVPMEETVVDPEPYIFHV